MGLPLCQRNSMCRHQRWRLGSPMKPSTIGRRTASCNLRATWGVVKGWVGDMRVGALLVAARCECTEIPASGAGEAGGGVGRWGGGGGRERVGCRRPIDGGDKDVPYETPLRQQVLMDSGLSVAHTGVHAASAVSARLNAAAAIVRTRRLVFTATVGAMVLDRATDGPIQLISWIRCARGTRCTAECAPRYTFRALQTTCCVNTPRERNVGHST